MSASPGTDVSQPCVLLRFQSALERIVVLRRDRRRYRRRSRLLIFARSAKCFRFAGSRLAPCTPLRGFAYSLTRSMRDMVISLQGIAVMGAVPSFTERFRSGCIDERGLSLVSLMKS